MQEQSLFTSQAQGITLSRFNELITQAINSSPGLQNQWVVAETSDLRVVRGHCYMELVEKNDAGTTVAKLNAVIWSSNYPRLVAKFMAATGAELKTGMKVLVKVSANYHSQFGFKAVINDIDPSYTMGDMARQRLEILKRLKADGIIDMNKELPITAVPQRIAVISAAGAAGYGDFMNQLANNPYRLKFYTCLFGASMQGAQTVSTVLAALDRINEHLDLFDAVVIIRGGGATSELNSFDNYDLAAAVAQFPLPVIVGIGHDRDETVLDFVAAIRVKTPTAAAEWLINRGTNALAHLDELQETVVTAVRDTVGHAREQLAYYTSMIPAASRRIIDTNMLRLDNYTKAIPLAANNLIAAQCTRLDRALERMGEAIEHALQREQQRLQALGDKAALLSPENTLQRGYALVTAGGKCVTSGSQLQPGDHIHVQFAEGSTDATVN